jgi:formiminoglutamase
MSRGTASVDRHEDRLWPRASAWLSDDVETDAAIEVIGVPSSIASLSGSGARDCPAAFRRALVGFSTFDGDRGVDLATLIAADRGDLALDDATMESSQRGIRATLGAFRRSGVTVLIGGDNAITRPAVTAIADDLATIGVITIDAHHDVRVLDDGPTNGTPIRGLIEDGLPGRNVAQVGIHSFANSHAYRAYCDDAGVSIFTMHDVEESGVPAVIRATVEALAHVETIYVDFDIDVLDRAHAPGCPGSRPGGMTPRQLGDVAFALGAEPRVIAADLVEVDPSRDTGGVTVQAMVHTFLSFASGVQSRGEAP